jgi:hypothetical protein
MENCGDCGLQLLVIRVNLQLKWLAQVIAYCRAYLYASGGNGISAGQSDAAEINCQISS